MFAAGNLLLALLLYSVVLADETVVISKSCLDSIAIQDLRFDPETMAGPVRISRGLLRTGRMVAGYHPFA